MHFADAKGILTGGKGHYGMNLYRGCSHADDPDNYDEGIVLL